MIGLAGMTYAELWRTSDRPHLPRWPESYVALIHSGGLLPPTPHERPPAEDFSLELELHAIHHDRDGTYASIDVREHRNRLSYWSPRARSITPGAREHAWREFRKLQPEVA